MSHNTPDQQGAFLSAVSGLAICLAVATAFLAVPLIHRHTIDIVLSIVADGYGPGLDEVVSIGWHVILYPTVYFAARASLATALIGGAVAFAARFII